MQAAEHDRILAKLRKLMAMAEHGNSPREQAIARRQAEALMRRYGIARAEVVGAGRPPQDAPPVWDQASPVWDEAPRFRADPQDRVGSATWSDGLTAATVAPWLVRLSWLLILFVPVSELVVSMPPPGFPNPLQMLADAWAATGLLAAVLALIIGAVACAAAALWWVFWAFSLLLHTAFWDLTDWSKLAMGPDLWHIPIAAALGALVAFGSAKLFGYDHRREHRVMFYVGVAVAVLTVTLVLALLAHGKDDDADARGPKD
jgi:hypothetical protein